jgi:hypothetical protein
LDHPDPFAQGRGLLEQLQAFAADRIICIRDTGDIASELVVDPRIPRVAVEDQAGRDHAIKRSRTHLRCARVFPDLLHDVVAVPRPGMERQADMQDRRA